ESEGGGGGGAQRVGSGGRPLKGHDDELHMRRREPPQRAAEDVGSAQRLGCCCVGCQRVPARRHHDLGLGQTCRIDAVAQPQNNGGGPTPPSVNDIHLTSDVLTPWIYLNGDLPLTDRRRG